jgi:hypothetical protein
MTGIGVVPYSARGLKQTLAPIDAASQLFRTVDGGLIDLSAPQFQKFKSTITGSDTDPPATTGMWPGTAVTVDCIAELAYLTASGTPERTVVDSRTEGDWTFYRPRLSMRVVGFEVELDEYQKVSAWHMDLEEA